MTTTKPTTEPEPIKAEVVAPLPPVGRCHWCGQPAAELTLVEVVHGVERMRCAKCGGGRVGH